MAKPKHSECNIIGCRQKNFTKYYTRRYCKTHFVQFLRFERNYYSRKKANLKAKINFIDKMLEDIKYGKITKRREYHSKKEY